MKKYHFYLIAALATATVSLPSCINDEYDPELIRLSIDGLGSDATTRAKTDATELQYQQFVALEVIHVDAYEHNATTPVTTPYTSGNYHTTNASGALTGGLFYHPTKSIDIEAYYPSSVAYNTASFSVQAAQNDSANYKHSDLMYANRETDKIKGTIWPLTFNHALSQVIVIIQPGTGLNASDITSNVTAVKINGLLPDATITNNLTAATPSYSVVAAGTPTDISIFSSSVTTESQTAATSTGIVVPQTATGDGNTTLITITYNGTDYYYKPASNFEFQTGKSHTFTFTLNLAGIQLVSTTINNWTAGAGDTPSIAL